MAKFCGHCGNQLNEGAQLCPICGAEVKIKTETGFTFAEESKPAKKKKSKVNKKVVKAIIAVVAVVGILTGAHIVGSNLFGYKATVREAVKAIEEIDADAFMALMSESYIEYAEKNGKVGESLEEVIEEGITKKIDEYKDMVGYDLKISYDIISAKKVSDRKVRQVVERFEKLGIEFGNITEMRKVELDITIKGSRKEKKLEGNEFDMVLMKEDGQWRILSS